MKKMESYLEMEKLARENWKWRRWYKFRLLKEREGQVFNLDRKKKPGQEERFPKARDILGDRLLRP